MKPKNVKITVTVSMFLAALVVRSDTFTWDGGGVDDNWQTAGNWNPDGTPAGDGSAVLNFSGNTRVGPVNDFTADTVFAGINLVNDGSSGKTSAYTLSGNRFTLDGNIISTTSSSTITDVLSLDMLLGSDAIFTPNSSHHIDVTGNIGETGGSHGLTKTGGGYLYLRGDNTYSGKTRIEGGTVYFYSIANIGEGASSLGAPTDSTNGVIEFRSYLDYRGPAATTDRSLFLYASGAQLKNYGTGTLTINGDVTSNNQGLFVRGSRNITLNGFISLGSGTLGRTDYGTLTLGCNTNAFSGTLSISDGYISIESISDSGTVSAIGSGSAIRFGQTAWDTTGRLRFNGASGGSCNRSITIYSQDGSHGALIENTVAGQLLVMSGDVADGGPGSPPFWLTGDGDGEMSGVINGTIRVIKTGTGTWTLSGENTTSGDTTVSTGTLLINGATASDSAITVNAAGTLGGTGVVHGVVSLAGGATLSPGVGGIGTFTMDNGGSDNLTLNGNTLNFDLSNVAGVSDLVDVSGELVIEGANTITLDFPDGPAPNGTYTVMTYDSTSGSGTLVADAAHSNVLVTVGATNVTLTIVNTSTAIWQGDGIANVWDTTTANWSSGTYSDSDSVIFDDTGSATPAINITPGAVEPFSVTVNSDSNDYTIGGSAITGLGGLTKSGESTLTLTGDNTYSGLTAVNEGRLDLVGGSLSNSSVSVALGAVFVEDSDGVIAGEGVSFTSLGAAVLAGSNTYDGVTTVGLADNPDIILTVRNNHALGTTNEGVRVYGGDGYKENRVRIDVDGIVIKDETLTFSGTGDRAGLQYLLNHGSAMWDGNIVGETGVPCYLNSQYYGGTLFIGSSSEDTITGMSGNLSFRGSGTLVVNSTISVGTASINRDDNGTCLINSTSNEWASTYLREGTLKLGVDNALPVTSGMIIGKSGHNAHAVFDLNGKSQRISSLADEYYAGGSQRIIGVAPSTLIVSNDAANTFGLTASAIEGEVTLVKMGSETLMLTCTNTTSGSFIVSNGTLVVSALGSFGENSTNVVVAAGTLSLESSVAVADSATVSIDDGATLNLDTGVNESVAYLVLNGVPKRANTYGASGSGANVIDDTHFSGSGILTVLRDKSGTLIILQ